MLRRVIGALCWRAVAGTMRAQIAWSPEHERRPSPLSQKAVSAILLPGAKKPGVDENFSRDEIVQTLLQHRPPQAHQLGIVGNSGVRAVEPLRVCQ